ncbi:aminodeoxychorismate lyase [Cohnella sp. CFH 77786]|uniref:aminodeoxychorismate lyase n=1 Tax=Cohnella sp. CFH 77786 TaxID=2662265 RepID=UPI001C609935|nr:aminodeoxychorismate lyase [Cohnella sp. CFH 77786]MBW5449006.1 aminodeoxychorismate lyase [Cohnella sp. CFH 77786]
MNVLRNGQVIDSKEAVISAFDHGFLYGMGLFETFRTYGGRPWLLERHAARLAEGCRQLGIDYSPDAERMRDGIARLLSANGMEDAYIRWSVSAGEGIVGLPSGPYEAPVEIVYAKELAADTPRTRAGKTLRLLRLRRSSPEGEVRLKSFHYMNNIVAKRELAAAGASPAVEGLFLDADGNVCEGIVSNVFWLSAGSLYTPSLETGPLPGITRAFVLEMAASSGYPVREGGYRFEELAAAEEVFLTNSIQEIVPVTELEDEYGQTVRRFASGDAGSLTREWMALYRNRAEGGER